jgi:putative DNA primase/helicase
VRLIDSHLAELRASGLTDATIQAAGLYTETDQNKLTNIVGWKYPAKLGPALVIPYRRADGSNPYSRIKPWNPRKRLGKDVKYESPKDHPNEIYIPPGTFEALDDPRVDLLITEGEKKALCADQHGFPCIGLTGVYGWKQKRAVRLIPPLASIAWRGRSVFIVFDSDIEQKPEVQEAESQLAALLQQHGAIVRCVRLPHGSEGAT